MRVARQSWPDAAAGAPADAPLSSPEEPLPLSPLGTPPVLFVPGWKNSGPGHWQTLWQASEPGWDRVMQRDWERPGPVAWLAGLDERGREWHARAGAAGARPGGYRCRQGGAAPARRGRGRFPRGARRCRGVRLPVRAPPVRADPAPADSVPGARAREPRRSVCDARARGRVRAQLGRVVHRHRQRGAHQHRLRARAVAGGPRAARRAVGPPGGAPVSVHETARLKLRELGADDAAFILELVNEPGWLRFVGDRNVHSLDDARGYIARGPAASYEKHGFGLWAVELAAGPLAM